MTKRVILITGTPQVGKTTIAKKLTSKLNALYVNLTELATHENLLLGKDEERGSLIIDENQMKRKLRQIIDKSDKDIIIDGHYAVNVTPRASVTKVFVLRRDPVELRKMMETAGFSEGKLWENLACEILDVSLVDALNAFEENRVCELDVSGKTPQDVVAQVLAVLKGTKRCGVGVVDWLGKLEAEGTLDDYLRI